MSTENLQDVYPLTPMQEGMLFHYLLDKEKCQDRYIYQFVITLQGTVNIPALEQSFQKLVDTYDILRTVFRYEGVQKPLQVVLKQRKIHLRVEELGDISNLSLKEKEQRIEDLIGLDKRQPFDLARDLPMRVCLLKIRSDIFILGWSLHHIIADGWSVGILCRELIRMYSALIGSAGIKQAIKPPPTFPFRKYMEWLAGRDRDLDRQYWHEYLQGYETHVILPEMEKAANTIEDEFQESEFVLTLKPDLVSKLQNSVSAWQITANILFQCTWGILLQHYNNTPDVVFGVVVSGRPPELYGIEDMVGLFINTIPLRIISYPDMPFSQLLQDIKKETAATKAHEHISLAEIQAQSLLKNQLIGHIVAFENYPLEEEVKNWSPNNHQTQGFIVQEVKMRGQAHYCFYIIIIPGDNLRVLFKYNACAYSKQFIQKMSMHFNSLLLQVVENPEILIREFEILSERERSQLIYEFNQTTVEYPGEKTLHQLWIEQVACSPDRLAVTAPTKVNCKRNIINVTHRQLYRNSEQLAELLGKEGIEPAAVVALLLEPSVEMMTGIWGTLLAGAIYLPIDPGFPRSRIDYTLADSAAKILLTTSSLVQENINLKELGIKKIFLDRIAPFPVSHGIPRSTRCASTNSPVYVLYTSGTTGRPKGVVSNHGNVVNHISWFCRAGGITCEDRIVLVSSYAFDLVYTAVYSCLIKGGNLHLINREIYLWPEKFWNYVRDHRMTYLKSTPSFFQFMVNTPFFSAANCCHLKLIVIGGEPINITVVEKFFQAQGNLRIINHYGPTETTIGSVTYMIHAGEFASFQALPVIGRPIDNDLAYILGRNRELLPVGVPGEIYIAGAGICPGYLNQPELTAEKFYRFNKFNRSYRSNRSYILYRTGDLGRWLPNGTIQCLGRVDRQVKIRGFRIELPEIENYLRQLNHIEDAAVVIKETAGEKSLWAYIVPAGGKGEKSFDIPALMSSLEQQLPSYMVPAQIIPIASIPLTPNGKIDQRRLPDPVIYMEQPAMEEYIPPCNEKETKMQAIWAEVLGIDKNKIGMNTNFFHLGGHSLKVMMMVLKIHKELGIRISLVQVFKHPQIREILTIHEENSSPYISLQPVEKKEYYVLSSTQKRLYILQKLELESTAYNVPFVISPGEEFEKNALERVFRRLMARHESLRTSFLMVDTEPVQRVHEFHEVKFEIEYIGTVQYSMHTAEFAEIVKKFVRPFDLSRAPLVRAGLIKQANEKHLLVVDMHHIINDAPSNEILVREFMEFYRDDKKQLPPLKIQYKDFAQWQNRREHREYLQQQAEYWLEVFSGDLPLLSLPLDLARPEMQSFEGNTVNFELDKEDQLNLVHLAKKADVTLFMSLLAMFNVWLSKLSGQEDIIVGIPIAARRRAELQNIIGMFVNTLAIRNYPLGDKTFLDFLKEVKQQLVNAYENQEYPFEVLVEKLPVPRDTSRNPVFDVMLSYLDKSESPAPLLQAERSNENDFINMHTTSKFDLTLSVLDTEGQLTFSLEYCTKLFHENTIHRLIKYFKKIIHQVAVNCEQKLAAVDIIPGEEREQLIYEFNGTAENFPLQRTLHQWFADQASQEPDKIALLFMDAGIAYSELNERTDLLAQVLMAKGGGPDTIVALMVERSFEMVMGIIGILKAGGAYLPIDPVYPEERINYMLADSGVKMLVTAGNLEGEKVRRWEGEKVLLEEIFRSPKNSSHLLTFLPSYPLSPGNLAYVIYTSGSTGNPKGVMLQHGNLVNLLFWGFKFTDLDFSSVLQFATISFDASFHEIFSTLLSGGKLTLIPEELRTDVPGLLNLIERNEIKTVFLPISFLKIIFNDPNHAQMFPGCVKHIQTAGEQVVISERFSNYLKTHGIYLHNHYGPTETHVVTSFTVDPSGEIPALPPIGKPLANTLIYILDRYLDLQPIGLVGELCIGGIQVGRGYLNNPELTFEKFIFNRSDRSNKTYILYKTGDLARWLPDGNIEYLGRIDHQVKIRGFRIEPGEIETQLLDFNGIEAAVVVPGEDEKDDKYLCAYIVAPIDIRVEKLRGFLLGRMPDYMIPAYFVPVEKIPLTHNGKLDIKALPVPKLTVGKDCIRPRNSLEEKLAEIWADVLSLEKEKLSIDANFFELGGHSLKAITMATTINKELNVKLPLAELFKNPTIRGVSKFISGTVKDICNPIMPAEEKEYYPLSSAQRRLYFWQQMEPASTAYNQPQAFYLDPVDKEKLENAFKNLIQRYESLRTSFHLVDHQPVQRIHGHIQLVIHYYDQNATALQPGTPPSESLSLSSTPMDDAAIIAHFFKPFDLAQAPLLRVALVQKSQSRFLLMIDIHHIISDGVSQTLLVQDFIKFYTGAELPHITIQYKDYCEWFNQTGQQDRIKNQESYWLKELAGELPALRLPLDFTSPQGRTFNGNSLHFQIECADTVAVKDLLLKQGITLSTFLLALYYVLLAKYSGQEDIIVGIASAGRTHADLQNIIGMFVNMLPVRNRPQENKTFAFFLTEVKQNVLNAYENQDYPYEELITRLKLPRQLGRDPLINAAFTVYNFIDDQHNSSDILQRGGLKITPYSEEWKNSNFLIDLGALEKKDNIDLCFYYFSDFFKESTIQTISQHYLEILKQVLENINTPLKDIVISSRLQSTSRDIFQEDTPDFDF